MQVASEMEHSEGIDPRDYLRQKEEYNEKRDEFMRKQLHRTWPVRIVRLLGVFQLLISLAIFGVDLPIILMFAPRWEVFAGIWTFICGFIACCSTFHSTRKMTWLKLRWTAALNIIAGLAAALMISFNVLYSVNPYICLVANGCNYLWYTYTAAHSFYIGGIILGIALFITAFIFLILFIKYGIGGVTLFEHIQRGWAPAVFDPIVPPHGAISKPKNPTIGPGVVMSGSPPPGSMPGYRPPPGAMLRYAPPLPPGGMLRYPPPPPPGFMPRYPPPPPPGFMPRYPPPGSMPRYPPPGSMPRYPPPGSMPRYPPPPPPLGSMPRYPQPPPPPGPR